MANILPLVWVALLVGLFIWAIMSMVNNQPSQMYIAIPAFVVATLAYFMIFGARLPRFF